MTSAHAEFRFRSCPAFGMSLRRPSLPCGLEGQTSQATRFEPLLCSCVRASGFFSERRQVLVFFPTSRFATFVAHLFREQLGMRTADTIDGGKGMNKLEPAVCLAFGRPNSPTLCLTMFYATIKSVKCYPLVSWYLPELKRTCEGQRCRSNQHTHTHTHTHIYTHTHRDTPQTGTLSRVAPPPMA